ncbi:MAG: hypothetical protein WB699_18590, partial [Bacteroidota bacterium]
REYVRYLIDDQQNPWCDLLDVESHCSLPREANRVYTDQGVPSVFAGEWGGGYLVLLPFDLQAVWERLITRYRQFPARFDRLPYERVSAIGRAEISHLIGKAIEFLHHRRGIPYARVWPFPGLAPSTFAVRLDTDRATRRQIEAFARCSKDTGVPFSWFVDTGSHRHFLDAFSTIPGQEFGIHCHRHVVYRSVDDYRTDIRLARTHLGRVGITPVGYAAPYGEWTMQLGEAIDDSRIAYSSEFGLGYDGFPFTFRTGTKRFSTPQIPVHPVSTGALRRSGYTADRMVKYFTALLRRNVAREEPVFLLDHPIHENQDVIRQVVDEATRLNLVPTKLSDFAAWWQKREKVLRELSIDWDGNSVTSSSATENNPSFMLKVTTPGTALMQPVGASRDSAIPATSYLDTSRSVDDLRRSRQFDLRTEIGVATTKALRRMHP